MYKIYIDGELLYHPRLATDGRVVTSATVELSLNETGSATFTIPQVNPLFNSINKLKSIVEIFDDDEQIFRGRVLHDERDFNNNKEIYCEGQLAFLMDNVLEPRTVSHQPVADVFRSYITEYNSKVDASKQFTVGEVTVTGDVNYESYDYVVVLEEINTRLIEPYGGYIRTRYEDGVRYIDYLSTYKHVCDQMIEFGSNMMDFDENVSAENICTVLVPLGAEIKDENGEYLGRVNIKTVTSGNVSYVTNTAAAAKYGDIWKIEVFNDISDPAELKAAGEAMLNKNLAEATTITINAIDLSIINIDAEAIKVGDGVRVFSAPHGVDQIFQCSKITYDLLNPSNSKYEFGTPQTSFSRQTANLSANVQGMAIMPSPPLTEQEIEQMRTEILNSIPNFNLIPAMYYEHSLHGARLSKNGITWLLNGDGTIRATGVSNANGSADSITYINKYALRVDPTKEYTLSGCPLGGSTSTYVLACRAFTASETQTATGGATFRDTGSGVTIPTGYTYLYILCWISANVTLPQNGVVFLPMLELGNTKHSYVAVATNSAVIYSNISQNASNIQSKVSTTDYNGATIASLINQSAASVIIDASHISLSGKSINLTSDNITISSTNFSVSSDGSINAKAGNIANWTIGITSSNVGVIYNGMTAIDDTAHNGAYLGTDGIAFGKANVWIKSDGSFKFGAIRSSGLSSENTWITNAIFITYGVEILSGNQSGTAYIDFHNGSDRPSTATDFTARIIHTGPNTITFYGAKTGTTTANPAILVSGQWTVTSDRRLKRSIKPININQAVQFISALKPSKYEYRGNPGVIHHGFIYDELEKVKPDAQWTVSDMQKNVMSDGDSYGTVNYIEIIPDIVAVLQQQMSEIQTLKERVQNGTN